MKIEKARERDHTSCGRTELLIDLSHITTEIFPVHVHKSNNPIRIEASRNLFYRFSRKPQGTLRVNVQMGKFQRRKKSGSLIATVIKAFLLP